MVTRRTVAALVLGAGLVAGLMAANNVPGAWGIAPASAAEIQPGSGEALRDLLALAPDTAEVRAALPLLAYADFEATVRAGSGNPDGSLATLSADEAMQALARLSTGRRYLQYFGLMADGMPEMIGVGVRDVRRNLEFGTPEDWGMVLGLDPAGDAEAAIAAALTARGFGERDVAGQTIRYRGEDGSMDPAGLELADPFAGDMGLAERLFIADGRLAGSPTWPMAEAMAGAATGTAPSLADDPAIATAVNAATDPGRGGSLLQFVLLDGADAMAVPDALRPLLADDGVDPDFGLPLMPDGALPPYQMVAFADRSAGDRDEMLVVLVYPDTISAGWGAGILADRLTAFTLVSAPPAWRDRLAELDAVISPSVVRDASTGLVAAVVRISYSADFPSGESEGGSLFRFLIGALWRGELTPLMVFE